MKTMELKRSSSSNPFCVPAALALMLDIHVDKACELLRQDLGDQGISGIFYPKALQILGQQGYTYYEAFGNVVSWDRVRTFAKNYPTQTLFVIFQGHVGVIHNQMYYDNSHPTGIALGMYNHYRRAMKVFLIERKQV